MSTTQRTSFGQLAAIAVGAVYVVVGIAGFVATGFVGFVTNTGDTLLGFDINPMHNLVHLGIGAYLLLMSRFDTSVTEGALIGGGLVYLLAAYLGFTNHLQIISINSGGASDNFLHLVSGLAAFGAGLASGIHTNSVRQAEAG